MKLTNEEKCVYCREYGNLPCDECNKKLEAKKAMSKRLEEIALEYADRVLKPYNLERSIDRITVCDDFIAGVNFAQKWISVEEELPVSINPVLVMGINGDICCGFYSDGAKMWHTEQDMIRLVKWRPISIK